MKRRSPKLLALLFAFWMIFTALACNLASTDTPTIVPRATATPPPTIGYATLSPDELPTEAVTVVPQVDIGLINQTNCIQTDRLLLHVDTLQNFGTRHVNSPYELLDRGIGAAYNYVLNQFEQISVASQRRLTVFSHGFDVDFAGVKSRAQNIVAFLPGTEVNAGTVLVGAHYDSITLDFEDGSVYAPGANDNASGVSALLELARCLSQQDHRKAIMFVSFSAEEIGRRGSIAFVQDYIQAFNIDLIAMINMDIIGSQTGPNGSMDDTNIRLFSSPPNDSPSRHLARILQLVAAKHVPNMKVVMQDAEDRAERYGDHMSFSERGYAAVRFVEAMEDRSRQHNDRDTIDDIQGSYLTRAAQTVLTTVVALADGPPAPTNMSLRDAGNGARTLVWEAVPGASGYVIAVRPPDSLTYFYFETTDPSTNITWDGFVPERFEAVAIAAKDPNGLMGPLSPEYAIR
ncbi:MAG: M20/M25/M40 family metallo-hydrolase [Anaerolineae bacterium]|nr:M20/M25/M40 family metallo-hydrolase [Anaerolineae bacterium]